tara:strand:+ start:416 stop:766 length:351 start_codon:yes stop_codon:yes gene_type:complete
MKISCLTEGLAGALAVVMAASLLAGCGGRVARPVEAHTPLDEKLTCAHISAEIKVNNSRTMDLSAEKGMQAGNNAGLILVAPLFINLNDTEGQEIQALQARNQVLVDLGKRKNCSS